jgi:hypothetical protein
MMCGQTHEVKMDDEQHEGYLKWMQGGRHIQFLIPRMSADDREMLMTGTDPECWNKMFPPDEEE